MTDENYMDRALALAEEALKHGEVPVGCVIVWEDQIVGEGRNRREELHSALGHAELAAIQEACQTLQGWRLTKARLFVTLEPCPMCAGAMINARVAEVHYGAHEPYTGACGSVLNLFEEGFGHRAKLYWGPRKEQCAALLRAFGKKIRQNSPGFL